MYFDHHHIFIKVGHSVPECVQHIVSAMKQRSLMPNCNEPVDERYGELMASFSLYLTILTHSLRIISIWHIFKASKLVTLVEWL